MPKVTVYIRTEDMDKWKAVDKKTEFIHDALLQKRSLDTINDARKKLQENPPDMLYTGSFDFKPCKHGADPQFCKKAKPGKVCK